MSNNIDLTNKVASADALKSIGSVLGKIYKLESTNITSIPNTTMVTIYKAVLPKGVYILSAKLDINMQGGTLLVECQNLRNQYISGYYHTLSGLITSDGVNYTKIEIYQDSGVTKTKDYTYDYVNLVRII